MKLPFRHRRNNKGFTLFEILISASIFGVIMIIAVGVIMTTAKAQRRVQVLTKISGDTRYVLDLLSQSIRLDGIDYSYYKDNYDNGRTYWATPPNSSICYGDPAFDPYEKLPYHDVVTKDTNGIRLVFRVIGSNYYPNNSDCLAGPNRIYVCTQDTKDPAQRGKCRSMNPSCDAGSSASGHCPALPGFTAVTPDTINVKRFDVWLHPLFDPTAGPPKSVSDCSTGHASDETHGVYGFSADKGICTCKPDVSGCPKGQECRYNEPYTHTVGYDAFTCFSTNDQQRATIMIETESTAADTGGQTSTMLQTTVTSRIYK